MDDQYFFGLMEALMFASGAPISEEQIREILGTETPADFPECLQRFLDHMRDRRGGTAVQAVAGGFHLVTRPEFSSYIRRLQTVEHKSRLSRAACETLAIIAYRQPITAPEIEHLRGVDSSGVIKNLLEKELVTILGRRHGPGNPLLYGTTSKFLVEFGLTDLNALPDLSDFEKALASLDPQQELPFSTAGLLSRKLTKNMNLEEVIPATDLENDNEEPSNERTE